ncbi:MAG: response regulator [Elusimicrobia bacterium]|nr:response regulator [Elusimicrobiota bacterium]
MTDAPRPAPVPASERTVLIVDDDEDILTLLEVLIHRDGFQILTAATAAHALKLLEEGPQAIVLDLILPGSADGFSVLETVEKLPFPPAVVVVTGSPNAADLARARKSPCVKTVLKKPLRQNDLLGALHQALGTVPAPARRTPPPEVP